MKTNIIKYNGKKNNLNKKIIFCMKASSEKIVLLLFVKSETHKEWKNQNSYFLHLSLLQIEWRNVRIKKWREEKNFVIISF